MRRIGFALLVVLAIVFPANGKVVLKRQGQDILMENEYLRLIIQPERGGVVDSCIDKKNNEEMLNKFSMSFGEVGGLATLRLANQDWPGNEWDRGHFRIVDKQCDGESASLKLAYKAEKAENLGLIAIKEFILRRGERILYVNLSFTNEGDNAHDFSPWIHNVIATKNTFMARTNGPKVFPIGADYFFEPGRNWIGGINSKNEFIYANLDYQEALRLYFSYWNGFHSLEWVYNAVHLEPGESWTTPFSFAINEGLSKADFVSPELACGIKRDGENVILDMVANKDLGPAILKFWAVDPKTEKAFEFPEQQVELKIGETISISNKLQHSEPLKYIGQLYQNAKPIQLGTGIWPVSEFDLYDTLTKRDEATSGFKPWVKGSGPYQYIQPRTLEQKILLVNDQLKVWLGDSLTRYFPQDNAIGPVGDMIKLAAAKGEVESFQLAIRSVEEELSAVKVLVEPVADGKGNPVCEAEVNLVDYIKTIVPSGFRRDTPIGAYPDPLLKTNLGNVPASENRVWWVNIKVNQKAKAGIYQGKVKIFQGNDLIATFPYEIEIYDFQLPTQAALKTDIGCWADRMHQILNIVGYSGSAKDFYHETLKVYLENRVTPREKPINWSNPSQAAQEIESFVALGANTIHLPTYARNLEEICDELRARDLMEMAFIYSPYDEAPASLYPEVKKFSEGLYARIPDIKILGTIYDEEPSALYGAIDIWSRSPEKSKFVDERLAAGDEFWTANAPFIALEEEPFVNRNFFWSLPAYGYTGILFWNAVGGYGNDNPWEDPMVAGVNGNAHLIYPHKDGPLSSTRWEIVRDGIEDYDYLVLLEKEVSRVGNRDQELFEQAQAIISQLTLEGFKSKDELYATREKIARLIEKFRALK